MSAPVTRERILELLSEHTTFDPQSPDDEDVINKWGHQMKTYRFLDFADALLCEVAPLTDALIDLMKQVEFVLMVTAPMTPQQKEVWPELVRRTVAARALLDARNG